VPAAVRPRSAGARGRRRRRPPCGSAGAGLRGRHGQAPRQPLRSRAAARRTLSDRAPPAARASLGALCSLLGTGRLRYAETSAAASTRRPWPG
jgi:hypothetical protein